MITAEKLETILVHIWENGSWTVSKRGEEGYATLETNFNFVVKKLRSLGAYSDHCAMIGDGWCITFDLNHQNLGRKIQWEGISHSWEIHLDGPHDVVTHVILKGDERKAQVALMAVTLQI